MINCMYVHTKYFVHCEFKNIVIIIIIIYITDSIIAMSILSNET